MEEVDLSSSPDRDGDKFPHSTPPDSPTKSSTPPPSPTYPAEANRTMTTPHRSDMDTRNDVTHMENTTSSGHKQSPGPRKINSVKIKKQYSKIYRIKTKILQNLGKADKTTDDVFEEYESNFNKQQLHANRLHKEVANYLRCARALHGAGKALYDTLYEVYETDWVGRDLLYVQAQNSDMLWTDFCHKMQDQALAPLTAYVNEFPELRKKIDKRGRKLVDYDSQRHQLENLQRSARRDEYKIARARDQLETAQSTYETLNKELYDELPTIYDKRIPQTSSAIRSLYAAEATFMQESAKIAQECEAISEKLMKESSKGTYNAKRSSPPKEPKTITISPSLVPSTTSTTKWNVEPSRDELSPPPKEPQAGTAVGEDPPEIGFTIKGDKVDKWRMEGDGWEDDKPKNDVEFCSINFSDEENSPPPEPERVNGPSKDEIVTPKLTNSEEETAEVPPPPYPPLPESDSPPPPPLRSQAQYSSKSPREGSQTRPTISDPIPKKEETGRPYEEIEFEDKKVNGTTPKTNGEIVGTVIPEGATTEGLPQGVLYKVKATYKYTAEDVDELGFEVGELINVIEYEDPEEQEEGWLCGYKDSTSEKGLFPANFTRPI